tara:strand:- start:5721 stop:5921 length:201 start_codon:yes stop_codon:yes gene_type:complete
MVSFRFLVAANGYVYELWRVSAQTFPDKNWLWKIRRIFQVSADQAIAYIWCWHFVFFSVDFIFYYI